MASALHIRGILLTPKAEMRELTPFQEEVYTHYARFRRTKALKKDVVRPYLPSGSDLIQMDEVKDIFAGFAPDRCPTPPAVEEKGTRFQFVQLNAYLIFFPHDSRITTSTIT